MASNEVEELLILLGKEIGKDEEEMKYYADIIVKKNWYDRINLLENISNQQWEAMNIPLRLVDMIRNKIKSGEFSISKKAPENDNIEDNINKDEYWKYEYLTPENLTMSSLLYKSIESLYKIEKTDLKEITEILFKIIDSIIKDPKKGKIRRIKMNNPKFKSTIGKYSEAINVLKSVGFVEKKILSRELTDNADDQNAEEDVIELPVAYLSLLTDCHHLLVLLCKNNNIEYPQLISNDYISMDNKDGSSVMISHFNPYISNISTTSNLNKETNRKLMKSAIEERHNIELEIKKRERDIEKGESQDSNDIIYSKPIVLHSSNIQKLDNIMKEINDIEDEEELNINYFDNSDIQRIKDTILGKPPAFKSKTNEYLKSLLKKKIYTHSCIRIVFPDKYALQLQFKPNNTTYDLVNTVKNCLNPNIAPMNWFVYQSPPVSKVIPDKNLSLLKAGFVPNAQLYFKVELPKDHIIKGNYLKCELMREIKEF